MCERVCVYAYACVCACFVSVYMGETDAETLFSLMMATDAEPCQVVAARQGEEHLQDWFSRSPLSQGHHYLLLAPHGILSFTGQLHQSLIHGNILEEAPGVRRLLLGLLTSSTLS